MPVKTKQKTATPAVAARSPDVLDVADAAQLLRVSADTVYQLFRKGELPGRKVGRRWITTRASVMRWIENSSEGDTLARSIQGGNTDALTKAMNAGKVRVRAK